MRIAGIQPFTLSDFPGCCACILFTIGCDCRCFYCHNPELWNEAHPTLEEQAILEFLRKKRPALEGVVLSGGEPTIQPDLPRFIGTIQALGYRIKLNTNGTNPGMLEELLKGHLLDYLAMDIKAPWHRYAEVCGPHINLPAVQRSLQLILASGLPHEFRTTVPEHFFTEEDFEAIRSVIPQTSPWIRQKQI